jgi:aldehyde:ferredoxin oxidoreductase
MGVYETARVLRARYGEHVGLILIGPGGEMRLSAAGIQNLDKDGEPSRINARGGLGAVMGAKGIKAIVIDDSQGQDPPLYDPERFHRARQAFLEALLAHPQTQVYADYGTAAMTQMADGFGGLPTRNFSQGTFEAAERIGGEALRELLLARGGESNPSHACMAGCVIRCSNCFADPKGQKVVSPIEYETIGLLGSNLGISELDTIARMNWELNDLGLDSIEIGAALGVAAEAGWMEFGDGQRALELIGEIRRGTPLGRVLGSGAAVTGRVFGVRRVPVVKGQAISAYDPRAIKGTGVTYATSPQGADHTAGLTIRARINHLDPQGQVDVSRKAQVAMAGYDTLGACLFAGFGFAKAPGAIGDLLHARYGWERGDDVLTELGEETIRLEREFNRRAGFGPQDDRLPEWMREEPLPPHNSVFDVPDAELDRVFG